MLVHAAMRVELSNDDTSVVNIFAFRFIFCLNLDGIRVQKYGILGVLKIVFRDTKYLARQKVKL